ncbi:MAG: alkaline phosphatase [Rhodospirillaceae bacterium]|nr:alkaline phosphatase [Rhodospirillaceae bacterium]
MTVTIIPRRKMLRGAALWGGAALAALSPVRKVLAKPVFINDPFQLGVACGDPVADGFVIWTRLAPDFFDPMALAPEAIPVSWEVAADAAMKKIVSRGTVLAHPELAHSLHVDVRGLAPQREYFYRFSSGSAVSRIGRGHTWPTPRVPVERVKFAVASCQHYEQGYFSAYRDMIAQNPDFIVHLGDYIYEISWGTTVRHSPVGEAYTLPEYRLLHALYKSDPDLQAAHAHCPWLFMWDDHELANDYAKDQAEKTLDPVVFQKRRAAAFQAYYEHMPVRASVMPNAEGQSVLFQRLNYGDLMEIILPDLRQFRDRIPCQTPETHAGRVVDLAQCPEIDDPARSFMGAAQERWFRDAFGRVESSWNVIAQTLMMVSLDQLPGPAMGIYTDNWGAYPAAKRRILDLIKSRNMRSVVSLGGDIHSFFAGEIKDDPANMASETLISEFVGSSITSESYNTKKFIAALSENPHIKFCDDRQRGYMLCSVDRKTFLTEMRVVDNVRIRESKCSSLKSFVVENGKPGPQPA